MLNKLKNEIKEIRMFFAKNTANENIKFDFLICDSFLLYSFFSLALSSYFLNYYLLLLLEILGGITIIYLYFLMFTAKKYFMKEAHKALKNISIKDKLNFGILFSHVQENEYDPKIMGKFVDNTVSNILTYSLKKNYINSKNNVIYYNIIYRHTKNEYSLTEITDCTCEYNLEDYNELLKWYDVNFKNKRFNIFNKLEVNNNLIFIKGKIDFLNNFNISHSKSTPEEKKLFELCTNIKEFLINNAISYINETDQQYMKDLINTIKNNSINYLNDKVENDIYKARELVKNNDLIKKRKTIQKKYHCGIIR